MIRLESILLAAWAVLGCAPQASAIRIEGAVATVTIADGRSAEVELP